MIPEGVLLTVTLQDGTERHAYFLNGEWWVGVADSPDDEKLVGVVSWRDKE